MDPLSDNRSESAKSAQNVFAEYFLNAKGSSAEAYREVVSNVANTIASQITNQKKPYNGASPAELKSAIDEIDIFPEIGGPLIDVLDQTRSLIIESNISVYHPHCLAHLHCPTFISSLAAEMIISAFNQSMDSWDQAPVASMIEQAVCDKLCAFYGFGNNSDAVFTGGGTMSNFMGLLLARDRYSKQNFDWDIQQNGLPPEASKFRILCAEDAHFTVMQSASILGLGKNAVVKIDCGRKEDVQKLDSVLKELVAKGLHPIAYVTTAGTTDFGSVGNINELSACTKKYNTWLHVDAAYGGALMFSKTQRHKLRGIEQADSVTIDFHKLFYQPISCGVFIVKNKLDFEYIRLHADYLNPESNEELGMLDLVYKSLQTTRRFDALKPFIALQNVGLNRFGEMIDHTISLAGEVADFIERDPFFELAYGPQINTVVFRFLPENLGDETLVNKINENIKTDLLLSGKAVIGQTSINGKAFLKFTLLNPMTAFHDVETLLSEIRSLGKSLTANILSVAK